MKPSEALTRMFNADRQALEAEEELLSAPTEELSALLAAAVEEALDHEDEDESGLRLLRLADLCAQVPGPEMADALITILDHPEPSVRTEAGESLLDVAHERFKEVARAVERALDRDHAGLSMQELPFILTELRDPDPVALVVRFFEHSDALVVAAAIEAMAAYGDLRATEHLERLLEDEREATLEDVDDGPTLIGELAASALEELGVELR